jgi:uncharacterized protein with LGFP repeats
VFGQVRTCSRLAGEHAATLSLGMETHRRTAPAHLARRAPGAVLALVLAAGLLGPSPTTAAGAEISSTAPGQLATTPETAVVDVETTSVPAVPDAAQAPAAGPAVVAELPRTATEEFGMVGVTWATGPATGVTVEVRTRAYGQWSTWTPLSVGSDEGQGGRPGTEPLWVGAADGVAARVTSETGTPRDVRVATIDPGSERANTQTATGPGSTVASAMTVAATDGTPSYTAQPTIITRSGWGASSGTPCDTPAAGDQTRGVIVHHTAGTNLYTKAQSASIVRAAQAYHVKSQKWCDIGYNFLVDKYGQIFEGRRGGMDRAVRGAHAGNLEVNTYTMGVSMMGNYDTARLTPALKDSMVKLIGWRMGTTYLKAKGTYTLGGKKLNMIAGHRDVLATACPGRYGYAWLSESGGLRDRVETYISKYSTPIKSRYNGLGATAAGPIFTGEARAATGSHLRARNVDIYAKAAAKFAYSVGSRMRTEFDRLGGSAGSLGYPTGEQAAIPGATRQAFDGGRVYLVGSAVRTLQGDIAKVYANLGETSSPVGAPVSSTITDAAGASRATFASGHITSDPATGLTTVFDVTGQIISQSIISSPPPPVALPAAPKKASKVKVKAGKTSARITWPKVARAASYDVCVIRTKRTKTCTRWVTGATRPTVLVKKLKRSKATDYYVKVRAINASGKGSYSTLKGFNLQKR